jgi:hypothetical protein
MWYGQIGLVHLLQSRTDEAIVWLEKAGNALPAVPNFHAQLAAACALKCRTAQPTSSGKRADGAATIAILALPD